MISAIENIQGKPIPIAFFRKLFLFLFLVYSSFFPVMSQDVDMSSVMSADDNEEIEEADNLIREADGLMEEANQYYLETFEVQADYSLSEKAMEKQVKQLESKAIKKQIEASKLYEKANKQKYTIYTKYSENFWKEHEGDENIYTNAKLVEEQAKDLMFQAKEKRSDALKQTDITRKSSLLNEAYSLENRAIEKQKTALAQYYSVNIAYTDPIFQPDETTEIYSDDEDSYSAEYGTSAYEDIQPEASTVTPGLQGEATIDNAMVSKYNSYVEDESIPDPIVFNNQGLGNMETFSMEEASDMWGEYQGWEERGATASAAEISDIDETMAETDEQYIEEIYDEDGAQTYHDISTDQTSTTEGPVSYVVESEEHAEEITTYHIPADEEVIYRVQIAANKSRLSQRALQNVYYGQKNVEMINEEGWFKYSVGDFETYTQADEFRRKSGVDNAFIVAYRKGTKFSQGETGHKQATAVSAYSRGTQTGIIYNVQVAASRMPLTKEQIAAIYKGDCTVELVEEEGWYKYQISGFRLYSDADKVKKSAGVRGVFISPYKDGNKIPVKQAIEENKVLVDAIKTRGRRGQVVEIDFHVQIIASKVRISSSTLAKIYSGSYPVIEVIEEELYKYQINAGSDYNKAKSIRSECGVRNAFIVAYKHGKKQKLYNSIRESGYHP